MTAIAVSTLAVGLPLSWTSIAGNVEPFTAWVALPEVKLPLYFAFNDPESPPRHDEAGRPCGGTSISEMHFRLVPSTNDFFLKFAK